MPTPEIFEVIMLICFGAAWPFSIYKTYRARRNDGKSIWFLFVILLGYLNGMIFQWLIMHGINTALILFSLNFIMVSIDVALYYRNKRLMAKDDYFSEYH